MQSPDNHAGLLLARVRKRRSVTPAAGGLMVTLDLVPVFAEVTAATIGR